MSQELFDFGHPEFFEPDAIGQPGSRRFRLIARQGARTASLWIEREQLRDLIDSIQQFLVQITGNDVLRAADAPPPPSHTPARDFPEAADVEFHVGPMALGFDEQQSTIVVIAAPLEVVDRDGLTVMNEDAEPQFRAMLAIEEVEQFVRDAEALMAAGRPRCPLCGQALSYADEPHGCVRQNGHRHIEQI